MASILSKFKLPTALDKHSRRPIDSIHITTSDWMRPQIAKCIELVPKSKISLKMKSFARMQALFAPTFGAARIHNRAFFVPMHTIFPAFGDFITGSIHVSGEKGNATSSRSFYVNSVPLIKNVDIVRLLNNATHSTVVTDSSLPYDYCFRYWDSDYNQYANQYRKFTTTGRHVYKIFTQLGYRLNFNVSMAHDNVDAAPGYTQTFSALPLFAFTKIYLDWYFPPAYYGDYARTYFEGFMKTDTSSTLILTEEDLDSFANVFKRSMYDSDYFVSAFDNPVSPNISSNGADSAINFVDNQIPSNYSRTKVTDLNSLHTPAMVGQNTNGTTAAQPANVTQFALDTLKKFTDYVKRHQLAGARSLDRFLARFGVVMEDKKIERSIYLGDYRVDLSVSDIMSSADTEGAALGDYAGKGIMRSDNIGSFNYSTEDDYGFFIVISSIVPRIGYCQGIDRSVLHKDRFSFWTPEFDGLGMQAISKAELFQSSDASTAIGQADLVNGVFGFTPRYAEYKVDRDQLSGDFLVPSLGTVGPAAPYWHLMRMFDEQSFFDRPELMVHSYNFVTGQDAEQYDRIFNSDSDVSGDKFTVEHLFAGTIDAPMCGLYDDYDFEDNGKQVTVEANGVVAN